MEVIQITSDSISDPGSPDSRQRLQWPDRQSVYPGTVFSQHLTLNFPFIRVSCIQKRSIPVVEAFVEEQTFDKAVTITSTVAWLILFYSVFNSAIIPCWLMGNILSESFTRNSWRYFMLSLLSIPFALYEQRQLRLTNRTSQMFYTQLTWNNLATSYKRSFHFMIWLFLYVMACKFTSMNHACHLTNLMIFFQSVIRLRKGDKNHEYEKGGSGLILFGIALVFYDSLSMTMVEHPPSNQAFLGIYPLMRIVGDLMALLASFLFAYLDSRVPSATFPPFANFMMFNITTYLNLVTFGYFCGGSVLFSRNPLYGLFGLFTLDNFVMVFYVSIMLGIGLMVTNILINQIFSQSIRAMAGIFQPLVTSILYHMLLLQPVPSGLTCIGFSFIVPGQLMIVAGQGIIHEQPGLINFIL